jgi:hypothetical protein
MAMKTISPTSPERTDESVSLPEGRSIQVFAVWIDGDDMVLPAIPPDVPARFGWAYPASSGWIEVMPPSDADTFH